MNPEAGSPAPLIVDAALIAALHPSLRRIARDLRLRYGAGETLRATVLVNEAFLKLRRSPGFVDEAHFLRTAARAMRQILVNHAAARTAAKRGGGAAVAEFNDDMPHVYWESDERLLALDGALDRLTALSPRLAEVVELRFFGGYSEPEIATMLGCTDRTVRRDWVKAKALLLLDIGADA
jgi:RNA polymerase sigma factor (TIGR02999 family)